MYRNRQAKIVATLGPATSSTERIAELYEAGADVFRFNMSHGTRNQYRQWRDVMRGTRKVIGPSDRHDCRPSGSQTAHREFPRRNHRSRARPGIPPGSQFRTRRCRPRGHTHPEIFAAIARGDTILLDDGKVTLKVTECGDDHATTIVETGESLRTTRASTFPESACPLLP